MRPIFLMEILAFLSCFLRYLSALHVLYVLLLALSFGFFFLLLFWVRPLVFQVELVSHFARVLGRLILDAQLSCALESGGHSEWRFGQNTMGLLESSELTSRFWFRRISVRISDGAFLTERGTELGLEGAAAEEPAPAPEELAPSPFLDLAFIASFALITSANHFSSGSLLPGMLLT